MITVGIICEYNPFHLGHSVQIRSVREMFENADEDVCIIALMSGSFVQRGGPAILSKQARAEIALAEGADLVLELPYPWCMSGADRFAAGAVSILERLGCVDYLAFGSESGSIYQLRLISKIISTDAFDRAVGEAADLHPELSYAALREVAFKELTGAEMPKLPPNDLLGVAYLSHLKKIEPLVLHRRPGYSATEARKAFLGGDIHRLQDLVPPPTFSALSTARRLSQDAIDRALCAHFLLTSVGELSRYAECNAELSARLISAAGQAQTADELVTLATSKHFTAARVRRAMWHSYLRTPKDLPLRLPAYTGLLAANLDGRAVLRKASKVGTIPILTRPSNADISKEVAEGFAISDTAEKVWCLFAGKSIEKKPPILK